MIGRLRDLALPRAPALATSDAFALAVDRDFRARVLAAAKDAARRAGVDVDACFAPPALRSGQRTWCPRCRLSFRESASCSDSGVTLVDG